MKISKLELQNYRNISHLLLEPCDGVNVIYGDNAQGKTNLMEAIWLLTGARSFRGSRDSELLRIGGEGHSFIQARYWGDDRDQTLRLELAPKKQAIRNEIPLSSTGRLAGALYVVVFSPSHLALVQGGPQERRNFLDATICQLKPQFTKVLTDYSRVLTQRAALLKDLPYNAYLADTLDIWDSHLVRLTTLIVRTRYTYLKKLEGFAREIYQGISHEKEELGLAYLSKAAPDPEDPDLSGEIARNIRAARQEDIRAGATTVGAHRDDLNVEINGISARAFGSQGQQRSVVLALKLAECGMIQSTTGQQPVVLLDDVMSELDASRRSYLLNSLRDRQIFITCCDKTLFDGIEEGRSFHIAKGAVSGCSDIGQPGPEPNPKPEETLPEELSPVPVTSSQDGEIITQQCRREAAERSS